MNDNTDASPEATEDAQSHGDFNVQINVDTRGETTLVNFTGQNCNAEQVHKAVAMLHAIAEQLSPKKPARWEMMNMPPPMPTVRVEGEPAAKNRRLPKPESATESQS